MELHVSLRGTLAEEYCSIRDQQGASAAMSNKHRVLREHRFSPSAPREDAMDF